MSDLATVAEVMEFNSDLLPPDGLSPRQQQAWSCAVSLLQARGLTFTGGCRAFHSPKDWGEEYGARSVLIVVHDGGSVGRAFSYDKEDYESLEAMRKELEKIGLYAVQCTTWYSAIYEIR